MNDGGRILVNGSPQPLAGVDVATLLERLGHGETTAGIAVAVNDRVVPRSAWRERRLEAGDRVEIVGAVQGG